MIDTKKIDSIKNRIKEYLSVNNKTEPVITPKNMNRFEQRAEKLRKLSSKVNIRNKEVEQKTVIVDSKRLNLFKIKDIEKSNKWNEYEKSKKIEASKKEKKFILEILRKIRGKGFNSQTLEVILENMYIPVALLGIEGIDSGYKLFLRADDFDLKGIYKIVEEKTQLIVYKVSTEKARVLRN